MHSSSPLPARLPYPRVNSSDPASDDALAHLGWVRALALGLARDANVAEDVVQDAYLLSLEKPPRQASRLGPWLARVTRTLARQEVRTSRSRRHRERAVAQTEAGRDGEEPHEILARGHRQRAVADAVLALPEPYAATVLYHYLDGLSTAEVARRMDTQPATVRKRLERARGMLRERLDQEFGGETESWALGLVLPLSQWRAPTATTGVASAGAKSLAVGSWMGAKGIGVAALVLMAGVFVISRGSGEDEIARTQSAVLPGVEEVSAAAPVERELVADTPEHEGARESVPVVAETAVLAAAESDPELEAGSVVLLVRGVRDDGTAVTSGHIDCFWDSAKHLRSARFQHHVSTSIESEVTRVVLPANANSVHINVSHAASPPSPAVELSNLHGPTHNRIPADTTTIEVGVTLGTPIADSYVEGDIYLDERLECPPGLRIFLNGHGHAWINTITSRYRLGPIPEYATSLMIASDYSLPTTVELDGAPGKNQRLDLKLKSGRKLIVHAVDSITGAPAVGREVTIQVSNPVKRTFFRTVSHSHTQTKVVNAAGNCRFQAVPTKGHVHVIQRLDDGVGQRILKMLRLTADMPEVVECEVQLEPTGAVLTRVFGTLPPNESADAKGHRTIRFTSWSGGQPQSTTVGAGGKWSKELGSHQLWDAKAFVEGKPHSDGKSLELKGEAERGPLQLGYWGKHTITLQLVDVPLQGQIEIETKELDRDDKQRQRIDARGEDIDVILQLSGRAAIRVTMIAEGGDSELGWRQNVEVDPRTEARVVVELGGSRARGLSMRINGELPAGEGNLIVIRPGATPKDPQRLLFPIEDGRATGAQAIEAGRWLYLFMHDEFPGLVLGWLDVPEKSLKPLSIDWRGATRPTAELGTGVELLEMDGVDMTTWLPGFGTLPWMPDQLAANDLWLPAGLVFETTEAPKPGAVK